MQLNRIEQLIFQATAITELNEIQRAVSAFDGDRMILLAPTGSGKTLAYTIAMLKHLDVAKAGHGVMALVLVPTRELAVQVYNVLRPIARGFKTVVFYGGHRLSDQAENIAGAPADIIVATPGRILDHLNHDTVSLRHLDVLIIDEYDKALELGFEDQMRDIARHVRHPRLIALTSATPLSVVPEYIDASRATTIDFTASDDAPLPSVTVMQVPSPNRDKLETLGALLRSTSSGGPAIVFVNHRESAERVNTWLRHHGVASMLYHGGLDQRQREIAVAALDSGATPVLVATNLAGRGIDIPDLGAAIHYHMPANEQTWTHRNGRTARAGRHGEVYVIVGPDEDVPEFVVADHDYYPDMTARQTVDTGVCLLYINVGRRDKVSKSDVVGWVFKQAGLTKNQVGRVTIGADYSLVAVSEDAVDRVLEAARSSKLKNHRIRVTRI